MNEFLYARVYRLVTQLAAALALLLIVAPVGLYGWHAIAQLERELDAELLFQSRIVEQFIQRQPDRWADNSERLQAIFAPGTLPDRHYRLSARTGETLLDLGPPPDWRFVARQRTIHAFGQPVGTLEISNTDSGAAWIALLMLLLGGGSAWAIWGPGRRIPLEALRETEAELKAYHLHLEDMVRTRTAELAVARDKAERASAAKSEFLSRMSHELRTPLNAILGFGQLLEFDADPPLIDAQADHVREIIHAGEHLLAMVNEVLDLSRIENGRMEISLETVAVAPILSACLAQVGPLAARRNLDIVMLPATMPAGLAVRADRTRFRQILLNLLSNAIKYNRAGGSIRIGASADAERLRIEVEDTGRGIAPAQMPQLFKPFERLESAYDGIEGAGIGLALVKQLVEAMHGKVGASSTHGVGSCFWFELPLAHPTAAPLTPPAVPATANAVIEAAQKVGAGATASGNPGNAGGSGNDRHTVLYIEDNPANLKLARKIFASRPRLALLEAPDAEMGLAIARRERPDLILLDINLPGMDGFAVLAHLKEDAATRHIPVVAVTANAMQRDVERAQTAGFAAYLTKPLDIAHFLQTIDTLCAAGRPATP